MSEYQPGTVAVVRCPDGGEFRAVKDDKGWSSLMPGIGWVADQDVIGVRPLVVLDPRDGWVSAFLLRHTEGIYTSADWDGARAAAEVASQIKAQVVANRPPRIPEPGQFGVVEAAADKSPGRHKWVRQGDLWWNGAAWNVWASLVDPVLIRGGLS